MLLNYIIWNVSPTIFSSYFFSIRWYGLCFAMGFIIAPYVSRYIFSKEGRNVDEIDRIILYIMFGTMIGARLGHVLFYEPDMFLNDPIRVFLPISFKPFRITGYQGLASHGAAIGVLTALLLVVNYRINFGLLPPKLNVIKNKYSPGSYLWLTTPVMIIAAIAGGFIRFGNFMNSEIYGKPTGNRFGVLFARNITSDLQYRYGFIENVCFSKDINNTDINNLKYVKPIKMDIVLKKAFLDEDSLDNFVKNNLYSYLSNSSAIKNHLSMPGENTDWYTISLNKDGKYIISLKAFGILRHPSQLYESISCFVLFFILFFLWKSRRHVLGDGEIVGIFFVYVFGLRFLYEFFKETKSLSPGMVLNIAHLLSIPAFLLGVVFIIYGRRNRRKKS